MIKALILSLIQTYQKFSQHSAPKCRFYPSCSSYAHEAVRLHGTCKGLALALIRILKCNPLFQGGVDWVPGSKEALQQHALKQNCANGSFYFLKSRPPVPFV